MVLIDGVHVQSDLKQKKISKIAIYLANKQFITTNYLMGQQQRSSN